MSKKIQIAIVDDNVKIAKQLQERLALVENVEVLFYAESGLEAISILQRAAVLPEIILMDIEMPFMDGIETTLKVKEHFPQMKIIMLTVFDHDEHIFRSIQAGATGYLLKDEKLSRMLTSFEEVLDGGAPMSPQIAQKSMQMMLRGFKPDVSLKYDASQEQLTKREIEILELLAKGFKNQAIADKLFISFSTVKKHIENIYSKLQLHSRVELVNWYQK